MRGVTNFASKIVLDKTTKVDCLVSHKPFEEPVRVGGAINKTKEALLRKWAPLPGHRLYRVAVTVVPASYDETLAQCERFFGTIHSFSRSTQLVGAPSKQRSINFPPLPLKLVVHVPGCMNVCTRAVKSFLKRTAIAHRQNPRKVPNFGCMQ